MGKYGHLALTGLALAGSIAGGCFTNLATAASVAEVANYRGADRQAFLEAGAKKEGVVMIYGSVTPGTTGPVFDAFTKKYPYIRLEQFTGDSLDTVRRAIEEFKAKHYSVDAFDASLGGMIPLRSMGFFQPFWSPELAAMRPDAIEKDRLWALDFESFVSLGYNTKEVSEADVPKSLDDLLDPKWKGKMAVPGSSTFANWIGATLREKDEGWLRKLAGQEVKVYNLGGRALANLVVSGEVPLSPAIFNSHMFESAQKGAPVSWRPLGPVHTNTSPIGLAKYAPHPHAGMLLIDFFISKEGQLIRQNMGYASGRTDIEFPNRPTTAIDPASSPSYTEDFEKWQKMASEIFGKAQPQK
jgi:iron(III) transport system substrate-binding protein